MCVSRLDSPPSGYLGPGPSTPAQSPEVTNPCPPSPTDSGPSPTVWVEAMRSAASGGDRAGAHFCKASSVSQETFPATLSVPCEGRCSEKGGAHGRQSVLHAQVALPQTEPPNALLFSWGAAGREGASHKPSLCCCFPPSLPRSLHPAPLWGCLSRPVFAQSLRIRRSIYCMYMDVNAVLAGSGINCYAVHRNEIYSPQLHLPRLSISYI